MEILSIVIPVAAGIVLGNSLWSCVESCRLWRLQQRVELLEDAQLYSRTQMAREQLSAPAPTPTSIPIVTPAYYLPPTDFPTDPLPPYRAPVSPY
jgi:hypothetical protein